MIWTKWAENSKLKLIICHGGIPQKFISYIEIIIIPLILIRSSCLANLFVSVELSPTVPEVLICFGRSPLLKCLFICRGNKNHL